MEALIIVLRILTFLLSSLNFVFGNSSRINSLIDSLKKWDQKDHSKEGPGEVFPPPPPHNKDLGG